jgi:predicted alpha/beta superfamily hydrolase
MSVRSFLSLSLSRSFCLVIALFLLPIFILRADIHLVVEKLPPNTPVGASVYVAGSFNNWNPADLGFRMTLDSQFRYIINFQSQPGNIQFKFTRGNWSTVEGGVNGGFRPNRTLSYQGGDTTLYLRIESWEDLGGGGNSTASPQVSVLTDSFYMKQMDRYRRIWLYLPPGYEQGKDSFPVLYMQDGQNLFDVKTAFAGEWRIDEKLDSIIQIGGRKAIVVGIENGGNFRINEYTPWPHPVYGGGGGDYYVDFLVNELKPFIDSQFRTRKGPENTGIGGSSLGGLISVYAALKYPYTFGKVLAFSNSFWIAESIFNISAYSPDTIDNYPDCYMIAGDLEGGAQVVQMQRFRDSLLSFGWPNSSVVALQHTDGRHQESYWAREFVPAFEWLFGQSSTSTREFSTPEIKFILHTKEPNIQLLAPDTTQHYEFNVIALSGRIVYTGSFREFTQFSSSSWANGLYVVNIMRGGNLVWTSKFAVSH